MGQKKVLVLNTLGADYQSFFIFYGLTQLLGTNRVVSFPPKMSHYGGKDISPERTVGNTHYIGPGVDDPRRPWTELWIDPRWWRGWEINRWPGVPVAHGGPPGFQIPVPKPDKFYTFDDVLEGCLAGEFAFILLADARWHSSAALSELQNLGVNLPVVFVDGEDYFQGRTDFVQAFGPKVYFKRSFIPGYTDYERIEQMGVPVRPLPFSSIWDYEFVPWEDRTLDLFCVFGDTQVLRKKVAELARDFASKHPDWKVCIEVGHPFSHAEYMDKIRHSKIVVDHQRLGVDTVRTWEVLSSGACMIGDICLRMPDPLRDKEHFIQYENDMSPEGNKQKLETFVAALDWAYNRPKQVQLIAEEGYRRVREFHTTVARAKYVLRETAAVGVNLGDIGEVV